MTGYALRRIGFLVVTLLLTSITIFVVTGLLPGDVARVVLGREASEAALEALRTELGLDRSPPVRYLAWLADLLRGDWGTSFATGQPVLPLVIERLGHSLRLAGLALAIAVPAGVALGVVAALDEDGPLDHLTSVASLAVAGLPEFVTGLVLIRLVAFEWRLLPPNSSVPLDAGFLEALPMMVLPALTAALVLIGYVARMTRATVRTELTRPYVRTARLKGIPPGRVVVRHVLGNALPPTITVVAISFGWLVSGLIVVENVFNYPGLGTLLTFAIDRRDLPLLQAVSLVAVLAFSLANLAADLLHARLDPRVRPGS